MNKIYKKQVGLLIKIVPLVYSVDEFAIHGGTAINLFYRNLPRYSVDLDLTYIPIADRETSLAHINELLQSLKVRIDKAIPGVRVVHKENVWKLMCFYQGATVKIEVNGTKRGVIGDVEEVELCEKARNEFNLSCFARIVPYSLLYGGKVAAALSRQHPRDLFDYDRMDKSLFENIKGGLMFYLLGSDKPILESLNPNLIDQSQSLENQFRGMTDEVFEYADYERARVDLIARVNKLFNKKDREFLLSFESGEPDWGLCILGDLSRYPAVAWKLLHIRNLKSSNSIKFSAGIEKLKHYLF